MINAVKNTLMKTARSARRYYRYRKYFPAYYRKCALRPVDDRKVLFLEMRFKKLSNSFDCLYRALEESGDYDLVTCHIEFNFIRGKEYTRRCLDFIEEVATARYVILDEASLILSCLPLRKETKVINLWHACGAFKKWGRSTVDKFFGSDAGELDRYPNYSNLDLVTVSSPEVVWAYEEAMNLPSGIVSPIGVSRTDFFFDPDHMAKSREKIFSLMPQARDKKVILYAPTFRGHVSSAKAPDEIDYVRFMEELSDEYVMVIKHHPFCRELPVIDERAAEFARDLTREAEIDELLCCADLCISDYSSLVFEYSLFEKPMIFYAYDLDDYCDWRGFYYDYSEFTPGPVVKSQDRLLEEIEKAGKEPDVERIREFRQRFMAACDGRSTERIMEWMKEH